jgi:hypothetical protein
MSPGTSRRGASCTRCCTSTEGGQRRDCVEHMQRARGHIRIWSGHGRAKGRGGDRTEREMESAVMRLPERIRLFGPRRLERAISPFALYLGKNRGKKGFQGPTTRGCGFWYRDVSEGKGSFVHVYSLCPPLAECKERPNVQRGEWDWGSEDCRHGPGNLQIPAT